MMGYPSVLKEVNATDTIHYTYGLDLINQSIEQKSYYYHTDAIGSTRMLTDESGATTDSYDYSAYGRLIDRQGDTVNRYRFTGEAYDRENDLYYLRTRDI